MFVGKEEEEDGGGERKDMSSVKAGDKRSIS